MYKYEYALPALTPKVTNSKISEIKLSFSQINSDKIPNEGVSLINTDHFSSDEIIPLEIAKKMEKKEVRIGYELLPVSFTQASREEKEEFFNKMKSTSSKCAYEPRYLQEILNLPDNIKVCGLRPLPYKKTKGLFKDFCACLEYYRKLYRARKPEDQYNKLKENQLYTEGMDLDEIYTEEIIKNKLDLAVFGNLHIEPIKEKLKLRGHSVNILLQTDSLSKNFSIPIKSPDMILQANYARVIQF